MATLVYGTVLGSRGRRCSAEGQIFSRGWLSDLFPLLGKLLQQHLELLTCFYASAVETLQVVTSLATGHAVPLCLRKAPW